MHPADDGALNTEERIWDLTMTINLKGVWWGCKYAIEAMRKNPGGSKGSIINTASFVALMGAATPQLACESLLGYVEVRARGADYLGSRNDRHCFQGSCSCHDARVGDGSRQRGHSTELTLPVSTLPLLQLA